MNKEAARKLNKTYELFDMNWTQIRNTPNDIATSRAKTTRLRGSFGTFTIATIDKDTGRGVVFEKSMKELAKTRKKRLEPVEDRDLYLQEG